jgi:hypothetical protein
MATTATFDRTEPTKALPPGYVLRVTLDFDRLSKNIPVVVGVNLLGGALLVASGWLFIRAAAFLRGGLEGTKILDLSFMPTPHSSLGRTVLLALVFFVLPLAFLFCMSVVTMVLHELTHGLFYWLFTHERPAFGYKGLYAYCAGPGWYMPRNQALVIGLAPVVILSLLGLALLPVVPATLLPSLLLLLIINASGAVGDLLISGWLLTQSRDALLYDHETGVAMTLFTRAE